MKPELPVHENVFNSVWDHIDLPVWDACSELTRRQTETQLFYHMQLSLTGALRAPVQVRQAVRHFVKEWCFVSNDS